MKADRESYALLTEAERRDMMNTFQEHGFVSDECVTLDDVPDCDLKESVEKAKGL